MHQFLIDQTPHTNQDVATPSRVTSLFTFHTPYTNQGVSTSSRTTSLFTGHTSFINQGVATEHQTEQHLFSQTKLHILHIIFWSGLW